MSNLDEQDFTESVLPNLLLQVRDLKTFEGKEFLDILAKRTDYEGTATFLVLDEGDAFEYLSLDDVESYGIEIDELFNIAMTNVGAQDYKIEKGNFHQGGELYVIQDDNFSAAFVLGITDFLPEAVGEWGAIVSIPLQGLSFVCPIEKTNKEAFSTLLNENFVPITFKATEDEENPITNTIYWYKAGKFVPFGKREEKGTIVVTVPAGLNELLNG